MKKQILACLAIGLLIFGAAGSSRAVTISSYPAAPGGASGFDFYVQTFTSPSDLTFLQNLIVNVRAAGPNVTLAIYEWSGDNASNIVQDSFADISGVPLFRTSIQTAPSGGEPPFDFFDVTVHPRINLAPSSVYGIVILDESVEDSLAAWAFGLTPYDGGERFDRISEANHWSSHGGSDFAFKAVFRNVPEPGTLALLLLGVVGLAASRRAKP